ncbi:hypothetical protein ACTXT7_016949 [Hymenolepis weldensis]
MTGVAIPPTGCAPMNIEPLTSDSADEHIKNNIVEGLQDQFSTGNTELLQQMLALLYNLPFNKDLRLSFPKKLIPLLSKEVRINYSGYNTDGSITSPLSNSDKLKNVK